MQFNGNDNKHVRNERTGWRDEGISERHRRWGFNCPAVDLDFTLCEYDAGEPYGIVEYKCETAAPVVRAHPTIRAIKRLGDKANLPVFLTIYARDFRWFRCEGLNYLGGKKCHDKVLDLNEAEYRAFMLAIRGRNPDGMLF
jgi:hypothetical protein